MSEKEYIVGLKRGVDFELFNNEMTSTTGNGFIPNRGVDIADYRPGSERLTHYYLTDQEADKLRLDSRVQCVEIPPDQRDDIEIVKTVSQNGNFTKTSSLGNYVNWGLRRVIAETNIYGSETTVSGGYNYTLDGTGVDIVIQDSGIQVDHPEFHDANGVSRVQQINWYTESGLPGTQSANHYRDYDGHGTHVAGIAAGKTYGWAKNARIYAVKVNGLEGAGDSGTGISITNCFDVIKLWHRNKPIDPTTGYKRPTIVNMSWGYGTTFTNINGGNYRGTPWSGSTRQTNYGMIGVSTLSGYRHGVRVDSVDIDIQELIDEGVHICIAAGNSYQKVDISSGVDYNNYYNKTGVGEVYYHRGMSPYDNEAVVVGNIDSTAYNASTEQKAVSSESGPGVDIYAPGTNIVSAVSTINRFTTANYPSNSSFKITNISGTSMASSQVAGVLSLALQLNPNLTPAEAKTWLLNTSKTNLIYTTNLNNDYTNNRSIKGSQNRYLYNPYNSAYALVISSNS